jgi:hypothetical protein
MFLLRVARVNLPFVLTSFLVFCLFAINTASRAVRSVCIVEHSSKTGTCALT